MQEAITLDGVTQVWVAAGEYQPASDQSFIMKEGVKIYGGFPSTGTPDFMGRNWESYTTILRGNGSVVIKNDQNGLSEQAVLDGFTITGGQNNNQGGGIYNKHVSPTFSNLIIEKNEAQVDGGGVYNEGGGAKFIQVIIRENHAKTSGGGMFNNKSSTAILNNVSFIANTAEIDGGGMYNWDGAMPILEDVIFKQNSVQISGGGMFNNNANPILDRVLFIGNKAGFDGGGIYNWKGSSPTLTNTVITGNTAESHGGGIQNNGSSPKLIHLTISGNTAHYGGGISNEGNGSTTLLIGSIVWGNSPKESNISNREGGNFSTQSAFNLIEGTGFEDIQIVGDFSGLEAADLFENHILASVGNPVIAGDYRLSTGSPAINAGSNLNFWESILPFFPMPTDLDDERWGKDLDGNNRVRGGIVDLGAYESSDENIVAVSGTATVTVNHGTEWNEIIIPEAHEVTLTLSDGRTLQAELDLDPLSWIWVSGGSGSGYNPVEAGTYIFQIPLILPDRSSGDSYTNVDQFKAELHVTVSKDEPQITLDWNGEVIDPVVGISLPFQINWIIIRQSYQYR